MGQELSSAWAFADVDHEELDRLTVLFPELLQPTG